MTTWLTIKTHGTPHTVRTDDTRLCKVPTESFVTVIHTKNGDVVKYVVPIKDPFKK